MFKFNNCTLCSHCIYLRTNSDLCHLQHKVIGFYNRDGKCLQPGTDWVFKWSGSLNEAVCACATYSINRLVFITEMKSVYSAVRTGTLNKSVCACATYSINWLVFITEMKSVHSAVRTGYLNIAVCASSLNGWIRTKIYERTKEVTFKLKSLNELKTLGTYWEAAV
jgi:hypothetical protein